MKIISITIVLCLLASTQTAKIDKDFYLKVAASTPKVNEAAYSKLGENWFNGGQHYSYRIHQSKLNEYLDKTGIARIGLMIRRTKPFADFGALKWGRKLEHLESTKNFLPNGKLCWSVVTAAIGIKDSKGMIDMRSVDGWSAIKTKPIYNTVRVEECKTRWFRKKCSWNTKNVPRGYTTTEATTIHSAVIKQATLGALSKMPRSLGETLEEDINNMEEFGMELKLPDLTADFGEVDILHSINKNQIVGAINSMVKNTGSPSLTRQSIGYQNSPRSDVYYHKSSQGTFKITLKWDGSSYTVMSTLQR